MDKEKEEKTVLLPLKTVNTIIANASDGSVKCSKSFVKIVVDGELCKVDAALRYGVCRTALYGIERASREGQVQDDWKRASAPLA